MVHRITLPVLLSLTIALAGCQVQLPGGDKVDLGTPLDNDAAKALLKQAANREESRMGADMRISKGGVERLQVRMAMDEATGQSLMFFKGDPKFLDDDADSGNSGGSKGPTGIYEAGLTVYATRAGTVMHANKTAHAAANGTSGSGSSGGMDDDFLEDMFEEVENATVKSVELVAHRGVAAVRMELTIPDADDGPENVTIIVQRDPPRILRMEGVMRGDGPNDISRGALMAADFTYGADVVINPSEAVQRAIGLAHKSHDTYGGTGPKKLMTFQVDGGIPLAEVEVHVKEQPAHDGGHGGGDGHPDSPPEPDKAPTLWSMKLSEGTKTQGGVTLKFVDANGDGKVGKNDTLEVTGSQNGHAPWVVVFDTKTGTYVVPPAALLLALLGLAGAALALRRRA